ncbi:MAG: response regulator [Deltaproteobacteria bacterium]|nr:response regulator [Deltaproteobacteria bacterium]
MIIETNSFLYEHLSGRLGSKDYRIFKPRQPAETKRILKRKDIDVVLLDFNGLKREGLALLEMIKKMRPAVQVIIINSAEQLSLSIEGMKLGAFDDLFIPFNLNVLIARIKDAFEQKKKAEIKKPSFFQRCQDLMVAASFAEAGEDDMAREILAKEHTQKRCIKDKKQKESK